MTAGMIWVGVAKSRISRIEIKAIKRTIRSAEVSDDTGCRDYSDKDCDYNDYDDRGCRDYSDKDCDSNGYDDRDYNRSGYDDRDHDDLDFDFGTCQLEKTARQFACAIWRDRYADRGQKLVALARRSAE
jgi:hypothetical protein